MVTQRGNIPPSSLRYSKNRSRHRHCRSVFGVLTASLLSLVMLGCLPGQEGEKQQQFDSPISNHAAKADRLDAASAAPETDMRVQTTATVIPTSAPDPASTLAPSAPAAPAGEALRHFFEALSALDRGERTEPVTILHLGDQHIAADRITAELRTQLQARFGDAGRGLMAPGVFRIAGARIERAGDWHVASSAAGDNGPFGLTGVRLTGRENARLKLAMPENPFDWAEITFATGPGAGRAYVAVDDRGDVVSTRTAAPTWQRIKINASGSWLTVRADGEEPVRLLSLRLVRDAPGVRYINLGVPGATLLTTEAWTEDFVSADLEHISPDLIVVGYGTNAAFEDSLDENAYAEAADALLQRLRRAAPDASLIVMGPPDLARFPDYARRDNTNACRALTAEERENYTALVRERSRRLARWHPPVKLRAVRRALQFAARRNGGFFWDWSKAMGGPCSIHTWVHAKPRLASGDHRHFTAAGARKSARMLFRTLMNTFETFRSGSAQARR